MSELKALSKLGMLLAWLTLFACGSTETGNPPVFQESRLQVAPHGAGLIVIGLPGAVEPGGAEVVVRNVRTREFGPKVKSRPDGSFEALVPGVVGDALEIMPGDGKGEIALVPGTGGTGSGTDAAVRPGGNEQPLPPVGPNPTPSNPTLPTADAGVGDARTGEEVSRDAGRGNAVDAAVDATTRDASVSVLASCEQRQQLAGDLLRDAYEAADRSCVFDSDCTTIGAELITSCYFGCWDDTLSNAGLAAAGSAAQSVERDVCSAYFAAGCEPRDADVPCLSIDEPVRCNAGRCVRGSGTTTPASPTITSTTSDTNTLSPSSTRSTVDTTACDTRNRQATEAIAEILDAGDRSCTSASDCVRVPDITGCHQGCGLITSRASAPQLSEAIRELDQQLCQNTAANRCQPELSRCESPPPAPACIASLCVEA